MRVVLIGSVAAVASSVAIATQSNGMLPGETICVIVSSPDGAFAGSGQLQTSPDNITFTNVGAVAAASATKVNAIVADRFIRLNVTARTAGTLEAVIVGTTG